MSARCSARGEHNRFAIGCRRSAALLSPTVLCYRPRLLRKGALVVLTLKVKATRGFTESRCAEVAEAQRMKLEGLLEGMRVVHLMANRLRERTLVGYVV